MNMKMITQIITSLILSSLLIACGGSNEGDTNLESASVNQNKQKMIKITSAVNLDNLFPSDEMSNASIMNAAFVTSTPNEANGFVVSLNYSINGINQLTDGVLLTQNANNIYLGEIEIPALTDVNLIISVKDALGELAYYGETSVNYENSPMEVTKIPVNLIEEQSATIPTISISLPSIKFGTSGDIILSISNSQVGSEINYDISCVDSENIIAGEFSPYSGTISINAEGNNIVSLTYLAPNEAKTVFCKLSLDNETAITLRTSFEMEIEENLVFGQAEVIYPPVVSDVEIEFNSTTSSLSITDNTSRSEDVFYEWTIVTSEPTNAMIENPNAAQANILNYDSTSASTTCVEITNSTYGNSATYCIYIDSEQLGSVIILQPLSKIELTWDIPEQREDGSELPLYEINGYVIAYGTSEAELTNQLVVEGASTTSTVLDNLNSGTYYFSIATVDSDGVQGAYSNVIQQTI